MKKMDEGKNNLEGYLKAFSYLRGGATPPKSAKIATLCLTNISAQTNNVSLYANILTPLRALHPKIVPVTGLK